MALPPQPNLSLRSRTILYIDTSRCIPYKNMTRVNRSKKPRLNQRDLRELSTLRHEHSVKRGARNREISGEIVFDTTHGTFERATVQKGTGRSAPVDDNCEYCYHTHQDHPRFPSPPSSSDLMAAYNDGRVHILLTQDGIFVFYRFAKRIIAESLFRQNLSLAAMRKHPITRHLVQCIMRGVRKKCKRRPVAPRATAQEWRAYMRCVMTEYQQCARRDFGVCVNYTPWNARSVTLPQRGSV